MEPKVPATLRQIRQKIRANIQLIDDLPFLTAVLALLETRIAEYEANVVPGATRPRKRRPRAIGMVAGLCLTLASVWLGGL